METAFRVSFVLTLTQMVWCRLQDTLVGLAVAYAQQSAYECPWPSNWKASGNSGRIALIVRGIAFRDCGHGKVCDAIGDEATLACAESHVERFVKPLEDAGIDVDVLVASYECPGRTDAWLQVYGERIVAMNMRNASLAVQENQLDSLLRALRLITLAYAGVLLTRADLYFLADLSRLQFERRFMFHADMSYGATYLGKSAVLNVSATTDKLFWIPGAYLPCFLDAVESGECFSNYDDDDPNWISGERCFPSISSRLDRSKIGFLRDSTCPATHNGTFGDNELGDGCYLVLPRALAKATSSDERRHLLSGRHLGPYATGTCQKSLWRTESHKEVPRKQRGRSTFASTSTVSEELRRR